MLTEDERLIAMINNLKEWSETSGAFRIEQEDIPIVLNALMRYRANRMMKELTERR